MASYNGARFVQEVLDAHESSPPSFTVYLHPDYWTLNGGSKFLYNNQMAVSALFSQTNECLTPLQSLLDDIRAQKIPTDFLELFDAARLPFYEGCTRSINLDVRHRLSGFHRLYDCGTPGLPAAEGQGTRTCYPKAHESSSTTYRRDAVRGHLLAQSQGWECMDGRRCFACGSEHPCTCDYDRDNIRSHSM